MFLINIVLGAIGFIAALRLLPRDTTGDVSTQRWGGCWAPWLEMLGSSMASSKARRTAGPGRQFIAYHHRFLARYWTTGPILSLAAGAVAFLLFAIRQRTATSR